MAINAWVVRDGLSGCYMPSSVSYFTNKRDAMLYMTSQKRSALDDEYVVIGTRDDSYEYKHEDQEWFPYCIVLDHEQFFTREARDQFISENSGEW